MLPGRIIGGSGAHTDRLLLDDEPILGASSVYIPQPSAATVPTPPRDGGRSSGSRDPRSDIFGNKNFLLFHLYRVHSTANTETTLQIR
jgi:hypothetical protein